MKSIFTKLSTLFLCGAVALIGCTDFSADLQDVNKRLEDLTNSAASKTELASLKSEVEALQTKLTNQYATKQEVAVIAGTIETLQSNLQTALANVQSSLSNKADKTELQSAVTALESAIAAAKTEFTTTIQGLTKRIEALENDNDSMKKSLEGLVKQVEKLLGDVSNLQTEVAELSKLLADLTGSVESLSNDFAKTVADVQALTKGLSDLEQAFEDYKTKVDAEIQAIKDDLKKVSDDMTAKFAEVMKAIADIEKADKDLSTIVSEKTEELAGLINDVNTLLAEKVAALEKADKDLAAKDEDLAAKDEELAAKDKEIAAAVAELEGVYEALSANITKQFNEVYAQINSVLSTVTNKYKELSDRLDACEEAIANLTGRIEDLENNSTALRSVVLIPETIYNGTKAVKFHRVEGENVLKTFAYVSFHFNPSNFDIASAEYEVMAESVEFMTKASAAPAIEIVGKPVQEGDKVTFLFERAEGAGNMFALKVTLADGSVIYSEYAAILDEVNFVTAEASVSVEVERIALDVPTITSLSSLIEVIKNAGTAIENYQMYIDAIKAASEAVAAGNMYGAVEALGSVPGIITKKQAVVTGVGSHTVQVETMTAETLFEDLMNASSISDLMAQLEALLGKAEGLGGEQGAQFVEILKNLANNNADLGNITSILAGLEDKLFSAEAVRDNAYAMLENSKGDLEDLKAKAASLHAELDALKAEGANAIKIGLKEAEVKLADAAVAAGEIVVREWEGKLDDALAVIDGIREKIDQYTEELFQKAKDYIAESEIGQAIKDLENAIAEKGWEGKKMVAEADAKVVASAEAIKDLIANYNALNQAVVDEFNDSIFGKVLSIIVSQEAEQAFAELGLTELHTALKQLPEIATMITKYYPSGMTSLEGATALLGGLTPDVTVEWTTDYELAE